MSGVAAAAAAILAVQQSDAGPFPAVGLLTGLVVWRKSGDAGPISDITDVTVDIDGQRYPCGCSGAFIAEVSNATGTLAQNLSDYGRSFLGRQVKVELIGGALLVAYTVNWS